MVRRQDEEEEEDAEEEKKNRDLWVCKEKGSFFLFVCLFDLRQEMECLVGRDGGRWESGEDRNWR